MFSNEALRAFIGENCHSRHLASRVPRLFLQRNLNTVLDAHDRLLKNQAREEHSGPGSMTDDRRMGWTAPTLIDFDGLMPEDDPVLKIDGLQIRPLEAKESSSFSAVEEVGLHHEPAWLPAPDKLRLRCVVRISVTGTGVGDHRRPVIVCTRSGTIIERQHGQERFFDLALAEPLFIELKDMFDVTYLGNNDARDSTRTSTAPHLLELKLILRDPNDSAELLSILESRDVSEYEGAPASEGVLKASWSNLPICPCPEEILPLRRARGHKIRNLRYGIKMDVRRNQKRSTLLERSNQARAQQVQSRMPAASQSREVQQDFIVHYSFASSVTETRTHSRQGLRCIWCRRSPALGSVDRLLLHYKLYHYHFTFDPEEVKQREDGKMHVILSFGVAAQQVRTGASSDPTDDYSWVAPARPFDTAAFLAGDESWTANSKSKTSTKRGRLPVSATQSPHPAPAAKRTPMVGRRRPDLAEVEDLPVAKRKKYKVPDVPGVTFYHSLSKQPLQAGAELSESDDELYDDRLAHSQRQGLMELGLSKAAQDFHQAFNRHIDVEHPESSVLIREGLVRFTRMHSASLKERAWQREFMTKLKFLETHGVIDQDVVAHCVKQFDPTPNGKTAPEIQDMDALQIGDSEDEDRDARSNPRLRDPGPSTQKLPPSLSGSRILNGAPSAINGTSHRAEIRHDKIAHNGIGDQEQLVSHSPSGGVHQRKRRRRILDSSSSGIDRDTRPTANIPEANDRLEHDLDGHGPSSSRREKGQLKHGRSSQGDGSSPPRKTRRFRFDEGGFERRRKNGDGF